jgi:hypothetical protein
MRGLLAYAERVGIEIDTFCNVVFLGGALGQTVSLHAALANRDGKPWGCVFCRFLSVVVQRDHCADQFLAGPTPGGAYVRAGMAFLAAFVAAWWGTGEMFRWVKELSAAIL